MPVNKNTQLRYQVLDRCFSDFTRKYSFERLLDIVNDKLYDMDFKPISIRQLREDISNMKLRPYNAPIKAYPLVGKLCYYRYSDENFSIYKNDLSPEELTNLRSTIEMLGRYRGIPSNAWLEEVISNLEVRFGVKNNTENLISFEQNEQLKGLEFLSDLIDCTINHQPLSLRYRTYGGHEIESVIHPYFMKQYNNRWFMFGLEESAKYGNQLSNKALDRIVSFSKAEGVAFIPNTEYNFNTYFSDVIGVTIPDEHPCPEEVVLKFDEKRFPYIVSKPMHPSQQILSNEECIISLHIKPNKEFEAQLFSYGPQVEVLQPAWLREQLIQKIEENLRKYKTV